MRKSLLKQTFLLKVMKISLAQLILGVIFSGISLAHELGAQGILSHTIHLKVRNGSLNDVLQAIQEEAGIRFAYRSTLLPSERNISLDVTGESLETVLNRLLIPLKIRYEVTGKHIVLRKQSVSFSEVRALENRSALIDRVVFPDRTLRGRVTDERGEGMPGVNVQVKGTQQGTISDSDGRFSLEVASDESVLTLSFVGYITQEIIVGSRSSIEVQLAVDQKSLEEVVVVGYGTQKKVNLTGAVDRVGSEVFENRPITNIAQGLVGAVPNLNLRMLDGKPTQSPSFNIRGTTSIGQGGSALVLIDGVEGDPRMLNPNDIESISVLKDASSASIYGARAAFGVVLITTKTAAEGKTSITYSANYALRTPTSVPDNITDSYPWAQGFSDAWSRWNDNGNTPTAVNKTIAFSPAYLAEIKRRWEDPSLPRVEVNPSTGEYQYYYSTDWYRELYKSRVSAHDHNLALSGGNEKATFYLSGRYNGQEGLFRYNSDDYSMYNLRAKGSIQLAPWLKVENNTEFSSMKYHQPLNVGEGSGIWRNIADEGHPLAPLLNPDGTLSFSAAYTVGDQYIGRNAIDESQRFLKNRIAAKAEFFDKALTLRSDFTFQSMDIGSKQTRVQVPYSRYQGVIGYTGTNTNDIQDRKRTTYYLATNVYADYVKTIGSSHNLALLAGFNYEQSIYNNLTARRNGIVYSDADDINLALGQSIVTTGGYEKWAIAGGFFRVNYNFRERYLLEVNGRYDGSSKFPTDQQWAFFPSVSAGWRLSEESFWRVDPKILSNVKLRASYGSLGNGNIRPYSFTENFAISQSGRIINGIRPQRTSQPGVVPSGLTWETSTTGNLGLELNSLNGRLSLSGDLYRRWTYDMFTVGPTVPAVFGTTVPKGNYADLKTTGWELSLNWADQFNMASKPFNYNLRFVLSDYKAIITKYNNPDKNLTDYYEGQRVGEIWGYQVEGLFRSEEEIKNAPSQSNIPSTNTRKNYPGDIKFRNLDGDNQIFHGLNRVGNSGDKTIIGNSEPRYTYGFNISGDWNNFFVSTFFQGVMKQDYYPSPEARFWGQYNRPYNAYPRWHQDNMFREELGNFDAYLPRLVGYISQGTGRSLNVPNDRFLQNASYIRLRNLQVGYTIPPRLLTKIHVRDLKVYVSGENLWTWSPMYKWTKDTDVTNIYGSDRDLSGGTSGDGYNYPMLKSVSLGLSINF